MRAKLLIKSLFQRPATVEAPAPEALAELAKSVNDRARRVLGRSLAIRAVDAGSCNGCEL